MVVLRVLYLHLGRVWYNYYDTAKTTLATTALLTVHTYKTTDLSPDLIVRACLQLSSFSFLRCQYLWMFTGKPAGVRGKGTRSFPSGPERSGGGLSIRPLPRRSAGPGCDVTSGQGGELRHSWRDGKGGVVSSHRQWTRLGRSDSHQR
jgi:hypothetical protein